MYLGDKGEPTKYTYTRKNFDVIIDNEKFTLQKLSNKLGFYTIINEGKIRDIEIVYDTERRLLSGAGLILRKKITPKRTYFTLIRISSMNNIENREKKSFLGECERNDQPSDFPEQIANEINKVFINLFTVNLEEIVKHCTPYIKTEITGNRYRIISGTGYEVEMDFENLNVKNMRTGKKAKKRNFSLEFENNPHYEKEREDILDVVDKYCKEMFFVNRNRFEIAEVLVKEIERDENETGTGDGKKVEQKKKSRKELKAERKKQEEEAKKQSN